MDDFISSVPPSWITSPETVGGCFIEGRETEVDSRLVVPAETRLGVTIEDGEIVFKPLGES